MPGFLRFLTVTTMVFPLFVVASLIPHGGLRVFGKQIPPSLWWGSGAGVSLFILAVFFCISAIKILKRSRKGRMWYVCGWCVLTIQAPYLDKLFGSRDVNFVLDLAPGAATTLIIAIYLYASPAVRVYFKGKGSNNVMVASGAD